MKPIRIGLMGFGRIGRQLYQLANEQADVEVVVISDIGQADILHHLLVTTHEGCESVVLEAHTLMCGEQRARLLSTAHPDEIPWDAFGVDVVVDATTQHFEPKDDRTEAYVGAPRVILATPPHKPADRMVIPGVNDDLIDASDRIVSAGSASTSATALMVKALSQTLSIRHISLTSVHAYTSDQSLQDYAGPDYRRSRSGAENIIPNDAPAVRCLPNVLPEFTGRISGYAMNVPVQHGSMIDLTLSLESDGQTAASVNDLFKSAATGAPRLLAVTHDPIVSSDVIGCRQSVLVDLPGTLCSGNGLLKVIGWHESLGYAARILDLVRAYAELGFDVREAS